MCIFLSFVIFYEILMPIRLKYFVFSYGEYSYLLLIVEPSEKIFINSLFKQP